MGWVTTKLALNSFRIRLCSTTLLQHIEAGCGPTLYDAILNYEIVDEWAGCGHFRMGWPRLHPWMRLKGGRDQSLTGQTWNIMEESQNWVCWTGSARAAYFMTSIWSPPAACSCLSIEQLVSGHIWNLTHETCSPGDSTFWNTKV